MDPGLLARGNQARASIPLKRAIERVPGGMMLVPLVAGAILATAAPHTAQFFGSFTGALFTGAIPILAVFFVCIGSTVSVRSIPFLLRKGGALLSAKLLLGLAAGFAGRYWMGILPIRSGWLAGFSTLALVAAINDTNGGLYMALMTQYGATEEAAAYSVMALESGPFFTMVTLGAAGLSAFPWQALVGAVLPLSVGMLLGNLDVELRDFLGHAAPAMIPFFAFALGSTMNLRLVASAGVAGLVLGFGVLLICAPVLGLVDRLVGGNGTAGIAAATTAGNAAAVPALVAAANSSYAPAAAAATVLVACSVIVTSIACPFLTAWWHCRMLPAASVAAARNDLT